MFAALSPINTVYYLHHYLLTEVNRYCTDAAIVLSIKCVYCVDAAKKF